MLLCRAIPEQIDHEVQKHDGTTLENFYKNVSNISSVVFLLFLCGLLLEGERLINKLCKLMEGQPF